MRVGKGWVWSSIIARNTGQVETAKDCTCKEGKPVIHVIIFQSCFSSSSIWCGAAYSPLKEMHIQPFTSSWHWGAHSLFIHENFTVVYSSFGAHCLCLKPVWISVCFLQDLLISSEICKCALLPPAWPLEVLLKGLKIWWSLSPLLVLEIEYHLPV